MTRETRTPFRFLFVLDYKINWIMKTRKRKLNFSENQRFGRLVFISEKNIISSNSRNLREIKLRCDCGNIIFTTPVNLFRGLTQSCGCLRSENFKINGYHPVGEEHWNWKGGITSERKILYFSKEYKLLN